MKSRMTNQGALDGPTIQKPMGLFAFGETPGGAVDPYYVDPQLIHPDQVDFDTCKARSASLKAGELSVAPLLPDPMLVAMRRGTRLDLLINKGSGPYRSSSGLVPTGRVHVKPHNCRCRTCPLCGPRYGRRVRSRMLERASLFVSPRMFTLTVKPSLFENDPEKAYREIQDGKYIRDLMKSLKVKNWFWILELQQNGFPHWHFLVDAPDGYLDLSKAWEKWGWNKDGWKIGGCDLGKTDFNSPDHAVLYITKYLTKFPSHAFRENQYAWVLDTDRRIRWVAGSRSVGPLVSDAGRTVEAHQKKSDPDEGIDEISDSLPASHRPLRWRQDVCGSAYEFMREFINQKTGELTYRYAARCNRKLIDSAFSQDLLKFEEEAGKLFVHVRGDLRANMYRWTGLFFNRNNAAPMPWADSPGVLAVHHITDSGF